MNLSADQIDWIRRILEKGGFREDAAAQMLAVEVSKSIDLWAADEADSRPFRQQHDALRQLLGFLNDLDPPIGQIRSRVKGLPYLSRYYLLRRARQRWPRLFNPTQSCNIALWADRASERSLVGRLRSLIGEGGVEVQGRLRQSDKQSASKVEPVIMGVARGSGLEGTQNGGRPKGSGEVMLITYLALDWLHTTGEKPIRGRSSGKPFGDLVHHVFSWVGKPNAEQALRRYWTLASAGKDS